MYDGGRDVIGVGLVVLLVLVALGFIVWLFIG
jgi:hypothetical protein